MGQHHTAELLADGQIRFQEETYGSLSSKPNRGNFTGAYKPRNVVAGSIRAARIAG